jgi:hypothetical protein
VKADPRATAMSEAELQEAVRRLCLGFRLYHFHVLNSKGCEPGWPDSTIIGRKIIHRELKSQFGRLTSEQTQVGYKIQAAGGNWKVWRPSDLYSGLIVTELAEVAAIQEELFQTA